MDASVQRLLGNAFLFPDPDSYRAGVLETLAILQTAERRPPEPATPSAGARTSVLDDTARPSTEPVTSISS